MIEWLKINDYGEKQKKKINRSIIKQKEELKKYMIFLGGNMTEKRFTTVELPKPNKWGIWYDGAYLSTYQVCILLNEYVDVKNENEKLKDSLNFCKENVKRLHDDKKELINENEQLKKELTWWKYKCGEDLDD